MKEALEESRSLQYISYLGNLIFGFLIPLLPLLHLRMLHLYVRYLE